VRRQGSPADQAPGIAEPRFDLAAWPLLPQHDRAASIKADELNEISPIFVRCCVCRSPHPALRAGGAGARSNYSITGEESRLRLLSAGPHGLLLEDTANLT
jgi:hypothetical protein